MTEFEKVKIVRQCCFSILPQLYCDRFSITEQIGKIVEALNTLIENNNKLEDYVKEVIQEVIDSGEIEIIIKDMLANYILNVKYPPNGITPASGDGTADDTDSIQGCINYADTHGGMAIYFPSGSYLTRTLNLKNKCSLFGYDRYSTRLVLKGGATTSMFYGDINEITITGLGFDGNMDIQVNNVNLFDLTLNSGIINNCLFTDGFTLLNLVINKDLQLDNIILNHAVKNSFIFNGGGYVQASNIICNTISALVGEKFGVLNISNSSFKAVSLMGSAPIGISVTGNNNKIEFSGENLLTAFNDSGYNNNIVHSGKSIQTKLSGDYNKTIGGNINTTVNGSLTGNIVGVTDLTLGNININGGNTDLTLSNLDINANALIVNSESETHEVTGVFEINSDSFNVESVNNIELKSKELKILSENPITYKTPVVINQYFKKVPAKDINGTPYDILVANDGLSQIGANKVCDTVALMKIVDAPIGAILTTNGYYSINDGGSATYVVTGATLIPNNGDIIALNNGKFAVMVVNANSNVKQFGAVGDGTTDDTTAFLTYAEWCITNSLPYYRLGISKNYKLTKTLYLPQNIEIDGGNSIIHNYAGVYTVVNGLPYAFILGANRNGTPIGLSGRVGVATNIVRNLYLYNHGVENLITMLFGTVTTLKTVQTLSYYGSFRWTSDFLDIVDLQDISITNNLGETSAISKTSNGDSLRFSNVHYAGSGNGKLMQISNAMSVSIDNCLNGAYSFFNCDKVCISNSKLENGTIRADNTNIEIRNNCIYAHSESPSITLVDPANDTFNTGGFGCTLMDNIFVISYAQGSPTEELIECDISAFGGRLKLINNSRVVNLIGRSYLRLPHVGIALKANTTIYVPTATAELSNGKLLPYTIADNTNNRNDISAYFIIGSVSETAEGQINFSGGLDTYYYSAVKLLDPVRKLGITTGRRTMNVTKTSTGKGNVVNLPKNYMGQSNTIMMLRGTTATPTQYAIIPCIDGTWVYDDGTTISGYSWKTLSELPVYNDCLIYRNIGDNVEVWCKGLPTTGTWTTGDIIHKLVPTSTESMYICITGGTTPTWKTL